MKNERADRVVQPPHLLRDSDISQISHKYLTDISQISHRNPRIHFGFIFKHIKKICQSADTLF